MPGRFVVVSATRMRPEFAQHCGAQAMIQINGMAHVILTVSSFEKAFAFYDRLMPFLGVPRTFRGDSFAYWVGGRTALGIQRCDDAHRGERFVQLRVGLDVVAHS